MQEIIKLARPEISAMTPYSSARREQQTANVWLNANENPWDNENLLNRYPEPQPRDLVNLLSVLYQVQANQILVARGSDEAIDLLVRVFCAAGKDSILITPPTYGVYQIAATIQNAGVIKIPLLAENEFVLDVTAIVKAWNPSIKLIFLCSPNNPTGNLLGKDKILQLCREFENKALIVVDEAYIEFAAVESMAKEINVFSNLVVLRTLSKAHGLAGVRCGSVLANPVIIQLLQQVIAPYPIPRPVADLICQYLKKSEKETAAQVKQIIEQREWLLQQIAQLAYVNKVWPSQANFIVFKTDDAARIMQHCYDNGISIRDRSHEPGLTDCVRITVGTPKENQFLMQVLQNG